MQTIDDIDRQARQGSVAAIIQILNEHFAEAGIRTRAVLEQSILELLCEAPTMEQLPQTEVVEQVRKVLETTSPRGITRVKINARIVQEQQLLWLDEIKRNPENQLLWSEVITLKTLNPITRLWQDLRLPPQRNPFLDDMPSRKKPLVQGAFWRGLVGGASLCLLLLVMGWALKDWLGIELPFGTATSTPETPPSANPPPPTLDPFAQAVAIAQDAAKDGQVANTAAEWLDLAARWQRASDLMAEIPSDDPRYAIAQSRVEAYHQNSAIALAESEALQPENASAN